MKYYFYLTGENKEDLKVIRDSLDRSKKFLDAPSGMTLSFVQEGDDVDFVIRELKDKLHRRNMQIKELKKQLSEIKAEKDFKKFRSKLDSASLL